MKEKALEAFRERFGGEPEFVVRAPARVNLIGEHTDYNDGYVLPLAIERATWLAGRRTDAATVTLESADFDERREISLPVDRGQEQQGADNDGTDWGEYLRGVAWAMRSRYPRLEGWEGVSLSDIPIGAGLSSSASFELAVAGAFAAAGGLNWDARRMSLLCHKAEVEWVGVNCGLMDHLASAEGRADHALLIDCRSLESRPIPLPEGVVVVILDTGKSRTLAGSAYNERRAQCEEAARLLGVVSLRDAAMPGWENARGKMPPLLAKRAKHVISENGRTLRAAKAMEAGDTQLLGELMNKSHESLRADYEVSCRELDAIVAGARAAPGCVGARMTGAGFGGCAVALVREESLEAFLPVVAERYREATGLDAKFYPTRACDGVETAAMTPNSAR